MTADRYLCLSVDVCEYGTRDDVRQWEIQRTLVELLDTAGERAGLDRRRWYRQPKGDEELALIPADEPHARVVGSFVVELAGAVRRLNLERGDADRLRLRLALDEGPAEAAPNGFVGRAIVGASRLVGAREVRAALGACPEADLVVVLSHGVFRDHVDSGRSTLPRERFRRVLVREKELEEYAWVWVPGATAPAAGDEATGRSSEPGRTSQVANTFSGPVTFRDGVVNLGIWHGPTPARDRDPRP